MPNVQEALGDFSAFLWVETGTAYLEVVDGTHWVFTITNSGSTDLEADPGDPGAAMTEADGLLWDQGSKRITIWRVGPGDPPYATVLFV